MPIIQMLLELLMKQFICNEKEIREYEQACKIYFVIFKFGNTPASVR